MTTNPVPSDTDRLAEIRSSDGALLAHWRGLDGLTPAARELVDLADRLHTAVQQLQGRLDTAEGRLAKSTELHKPERRYTPDDGETSYAEYFEAADASFDGVGTPRSVTFFEVCSHCASIEMAEGCDHQYKESLWPCKDAVALGLDGGGSDEM